MGQRLSFFSRALGAVLLFCMMFGYGKVSLYAQFHKNISLEGHLSYTECVSSLWGYTDTQGREYALVGTCSGTSIVDINTPGSPEELFFVPGPQSIWREMKTWKHFAYIVTEGGGGLTIVDLSNLPDNNLSYTVYQNTPEGTITNGHTIWIDEKGRCYIFGATGFNNGAGSGCIMLDLKPDPQNPVYIGTKDGAYYHDGFVRGDTLWGSAIYAGYLEMFDMSEPMSPIFLGNVNTPGNFTHNAWPSDDGKYVFTTDEIPDGVLAAYDMSDTYNVSEVDRIQMDPDGNETPHNVHYLNGWLPVAYYREGVVIVDAHRPENMVITGYYDTFFPDTGSNMEGVWEAYPYFPSGRIIAGDRQNGLFILKPQYIRAAYLEGTVTDTATGLPIPGAKVLFSALMPGDSLTTAIDGTYKTGSADAGTCVVTVEKNGYQSKTLYVQIQNGELTVLDVALRPEGYVLVSPTDDFSDFKAGPVPAMDNLTLSGIPFLVTSIQVFDIAGKRVADYSLQSQNYLSVNTSEWATGVYVVAFFQGKEKVKRVKIPKI